MKQMKLAALAVLLVFGAASAQDMTRKMELKVVAVARAILEELLLDCEDFLRHGGLSLRGKEHPQSQAVRMLAHSKDRSYKTYRSSIEKEEPEVAANTLVCLIHQTNYLLDQQLRQLEDRFLKEGGFTERLYNNRRISRGSK